MIPKYIKNIAKVLGIVKIIEIFENTFRTRFATDMYIAQVQVVSKTHEETFGSYKNKYQGQNIAIIATGPSLNNYKPIKNVINIGVNKAFKYDKIPLNYCFIQDFETKDYIEDLANYANITKFYGVLPMHPYGCKMSSNRNFIMPESLIIRHNAKKYYLYPKRPNKDFQFNTDIDKTWITDCGSVTLSAMQFALFTNPKRIYLVGCDCSSGYFNGKGKNNAKPFIKVWKELKEFADIYYPETEIISVNPVGLKGIFKDLYQE